MFDKLKKRRCYPVEGLDGVFLRLLNAAEADRLHKMPAELKNRFGLAVALVNEDGSVAFPKAADETDEAYTTRFCLEAVDFDAEAEKLVADTYGTLVKGQPKEAGGTVSIEDIAKN